MKISLIGHLGYIGQNFKKILNQNESFELFLIDRETITENLIIYLSKSDIIIHCAAIQRHELNIEESFAPNYDLTKFVVDNMNKQAKLIFISTIQYNSKTPFGNIRKSEEKYITENVINYTIYHLPYTYGPYGRSNHNNVFNTFIINVLNNKEVIVRDFNKDFPLLLIINFVNKVVKEFNLREKIVDDFDVVKITLTNFLFELSKIHKGIEPKSDFSIDLKKVYEWYKHK